MKSLHSSIARFTLAALLLFGFAGASGAATFEQAHESARADLRQALDELRQLNEQIAAEKIPLARQVTELEEKVLTRRREFERARRQRDQEAEGAEQLQAEVKARHEENSYLSSLLDEYVRTFETRIHISELQRYQPAITTARQAPDDINLTGAEKFARQIAAVKTALQRLENQLGGETFEGRALASDGRMEDGTFALLGPIALFASEQRPNVGLVELQLGSPAPAVVEIGSEFAEGIRQITKAGSGNLPLDPTLGKALKIVSTRDTFAEHIRKGGVVMVPILLLAVLAILISIWKWAEIAGIRLAGPHELQGILNALNRGDRKTALDQARAVKGPIGEMLAVGIEHVDHKKELLEEMLYEKMLHVRPRLERLLPFLAVTAATAPLLGLLGTVIGMITTFKMIMIFGTGDARTLSSGISEALITTEFGLIVAIPALLLHAVLSRRAKGVLAGMERAAIGFVNGLPKRD